MVKLCMTERSGKAGGNDMYLSTERINPVLLSGWRWTAYPFAKSGFRMEARRVYEYEIEFFTRSDGGVWIDGAYQPFAAGDINFRRPGQTVRGVGPYACLTLVVDLTGNSERPASAERFGTAERAAPQYENPLLDSIPVRLPMRDVRKVEQLLLNLIDAPHAREEQRFNSRMLLMRLFQEMFHAAAPNRAACPPAVRAAYERISREYTTPLNIGALISASGLSNAYFHAAFRAFAGCSPARLITRLRIELAQTMLADSRVSVADIAMWCGYDDPSYFARVFHRTTACTPSEWRGKHAEE